VKAAVEAADARRHERKSQAAKKAAETRARRREKKVYSVVTRLLAADPIGPRINCIVCGRGLTDAQSIDRGIGSECWQDILKGIAERTGTQHVE
jgi:hypothetical protein